MNSAVRFASVAFGGTMLRTSVVTLLTATVVAVAAVTGQGAAPRINLNGKLYRSVFTSGMGMLAPADLADIPEPLQSRLRTYLARRAQFKSNYKSEPDDLHQVRSDAKRRALERSIFALIDTPGIEKLAADFVAAAPIAYEWEGMHDGPLAEANFAEGVLKRNPSTPLAAWCYVFIAERHRVAFETYENEKNEEGMKASAAKYQSFIEPARAATDPIYAALVEDMDHQSYLYIKSTKHPREYGTGQ
jgi:hypothetical protein